MQVQPFADFLKGHHTKTAPAILRDLAGKAFLLVRQEGAAPSILRLDPERPARVGSEQGCDLSVPGLWPEHFELRYHLGFMGWVLLCHHELSVNARSAPTHRPYLLASRDVLRFPEASARLEFYEADALVERMRSAGATRRTPRGDESRSGAPPLATRPLSSLTRLLTSKPLDLRLSRG